MKFILHEWKTRPLRFVMTLALTLRLIAVFTAPGYLMHDDHFLVVEAAASWADGEDYNNWLPWNMEGEQQAHPANFAYVGTQYFIFELLNGIGIDDPKVQMIIVRLVHACYSLLIVWFSFLIVKRISNERTAALTGLLLAALAIMPNFSVRQLVEMICIPPLLWATWVLIKRQGNYRWTDFVIAGIGIGLATGFRFQCGVFGIGFGLALLLLREWKGAFILGFSSLAFFALAQIQDVFIWGEPFTQLQAYIDYNDQNAGNYPNGPWYMYLLTLAGFLVPPVSIMLLFGYFYIGRKHLLLFVPSLAFFVFHSYFPNKQERFIFPVIPYVVMLGVIGWHVWTNRSAFWQARPKLNKGLWSAFWVINIAALILLTFTYGKRARVESMHYLYEQGDLENFMIVFAKSGAMPPQYYSGNWAHYYWFKPGETELATHSSRICNAKEIRTMPNYIIFYGADAESVVVEEFESRFSTLEYLTTEEPGLLDRILHQLNPINSVETARIYKIDPQEFCTTQ